MNLQNELLNLAELDRQIIRAFMENDGDVLQLALADFLETRDRVQEVLLDSAAVDIECDEARAILQKMTTGGGLHAEKLISQLSGSAGNSFDPTFDEDTVQELGEKLFYSWFSHHEYIEALSELRPLIISSKSSDAVSDLIHQTRHCYAFQEYNAVVTLCRALIEVCIRDICVRRELFPDVEDDIVLFEKYNWSALRHKVTSGKAETRLRNFYSDLSTVVHGRERRVIGQDVAYQTFQTTLEILEDLHRDHDL